MKAFSVILALAAQSLAAQVTVEPEEDAMQERAVFGGEKACFDLAVEAPAGEKVSLAYDLSQVAGALLVPLVRRQALGGPVDFRDRTRRVIPVEVPAPEVARRTRMLVLFYSLPPSDKSSPTGPARAYLDVFPKPKTGEWAKALEAAEKRAGVRIAIFGTSPALRKFFEDRKIAFHDLGGEFPAEFPAEFLVLGQVTAADLEKHRSEAAAGRMVFFLTGAELPPGVYETVTPEGSLTKVTLPLADGLATNPLSQVVFLDILHRQLRPGIASP